MSGVRPDGRTSNYGWALWHLEQAEISPTPDVALIHTSAAQARAALASIDLAEGRFEGSTWTATPSATTPTTTEASTR